MCTYPNNEKVSSYLNGSNDNEGILCIPPKLHWCLCVPEIRTANIYRKLVWSFILAIKGTPTNHDTQTCCLGLTLNSVGFIIFHG